ncbi:hypothetical protein EDB80DRAFT_684513 [Ilyonectria destructans]|nr:hypothetical protein EDB80DRAFT_684513 [Ilyonectria destructans]
MTCWTCGLRTNRKVPGLYDGSRIRALTGSWVFLPQVAEAAEAFLELSSSLGISGHERNRGLGQNRWKERVSNSDLEPRPELVGWVVMLTDVGKTNYPASSGEILIIGSVSLMSDAHRDKLYNMVGDAQWRTSENLENQEAVGRDTTKETERVMDTKHGAGSN